MIWIALAFAQPPCPEGAACVYEEERLVAAVWREDDEDRRRIRGVYDDEGALLGLEDSVWVRPGRLLPAGSDHYVHVDADSFRTRVCLLLEPVEGPDVTRVCDGDTCDCEWRTIPEDPSHLALSLELPEIDWATVGATAPAPRRIERHREVLGEVLGREYGYVVTLPDGPGPHPVLLIPNHPTGLDPESLLQPDDWAVVLVDGYNLFSDAPSYRQRVSDRKRLRLKLLEAQRTALDHAIAAFDLDDDHIVCTGVSASGNQCWDLGIHWPGVFAGLWPISAGYNPDHQPDCWANLSEQHIYVLHGLDDELIADDAVDLAVERVRQEGARVVDVRVEGGGHGVFPPEVWDAGFRWAKALPAPASIDTGCVPGNR